MLTYTFSLYFFEFCAPAFSEYQKKSLPVFPILMVILRRFHEVVHMCFVGPLVT